MRAFDDMIFAPMLITDVFETVKASAAWYDKAKLVSRRDAPFPFVSRTRASNGIDGFCARQEKGPEASGALTIGLDTQTVAYQPVPFYTSQNIQVLRHKKLNQRNALVLVALLQQQMGKFSWGGNGATLSRLRRTRIMVPVVADASGVQAVDWDSMTRLGEELFDKAVTHTYSARTTDPADDDTPPALQCEPMLITDVFETVRQAPSWLNTNRVLDGEAAFPHVTNTAVGNSVAGFIAEQDTPPNQGNAITIGIDTQVVAYQPAPYYGATKVLELRAAEMNMSSALVLVSSLRKAVEKFSWGYKASARRIARTRIMVPVTTDAHGEKAVDWDGMSAYGRALRVHAERHSLLP